MCLPLFQQPSTSSPFTSFQPTNLTALVNRLSGVGPLGQLYLYLSFAEQLNTSKITRSDYVAWGQAVRLLVLKGMKIFSHDLQKLVNKTHNLQELVLRPAPAISGEYEGFDANTLQLAHTPLKSLTLQNQQITRQLLTQLQPDSLTHLHVMDSHFSLPPKSFVLQQFSHLKHLNLESCCLNSDTLQQIATICSLERLAFTSCELSENWREGRMFTITTLPDLTTLSLLVELDVTGTAISIESFTKALQQVPNLRVFTYHDCDAVNHAYLEALATHCPHLEVLDIAGCENISNDNIQEFEKIRHKLGLPPVKIVSS